ncbi:MAG: IPT/TIG domain-containing protein, partial [Planctomycetota bacterium]
MTALRSTAVSSFALSLVCALFLGLSPAAAQTFEDELTASDAAFGDQLGGSVSMSGDTLVAGARSDDSSKGAAYAFRRGTGGWTEEQKLTGSGTVAQDWFGASVSIDGDVIVSGAPDPFDPFGPASGPGDVFVFRRTGVTWSQEDTFSSSDGQTLDQFGFSVSVSGTRAAVGARGDEPSGPGARFNGTGAAYVFTESGGNWTQQDKVTASDAASGDGFGHAVHLDGDVLVVGAPGKTGGGAVYVFRRSGSNWNQEQKMTASDAAAGDEFGYSVSVSGDVLVVGAYQNDDGGTDSGSAYVFRRTAGTWNEEQKLLAGDAAADDFFGTAVDIEGEDVLVGAWGENLGAGAAYRFEKPAATWNQTAKLTRPNTGLLGAGVAVSYPFAAAGAPITDSVAGFAGAAYTWCTSPGPSLISLSPSFGQVKGGDAVTLTGANFVDFKTITVTFDGVPATGVVRVSDSQVDCVSPAGVQGAFADVVVTQNGLSDTLLNAYEYKGTEIASVTPGVGPAVGGPNITISGDYFLDDGSTVVTFGGLTAGIVSITPPNTIVVTAPMGTRGSTVDVTVSSNNGIDTLVGGFSYETTVVTSVSPTSGPAVGGGPITITGDFFIDDGSTVVTFDALVASIVSITPPNTIVVNAPAGTRGSTVDVTVSSNNGTGTLIDAFSYEVTTVTSISPTSGPPIGSPPVTITGDFFIDNGSTSVTFGALNAPIVSITPPNTIVVNVPQGTRGTTVDVTVSSDNGVGVLSNAFTYESTIVTSVSPSSGPSVGSPPVTITGDYFLDNGSTTVFFGPNAATINSITPPNSMSVNIPIGVSGSTVDVTVSSDNGTGVLVNGFTYDQTSVSGITKNFGPPAGGTTHVITGGLFIDDGSTVVTIGGNVASINSITPPSEIEITLPAGTPGATVDVTVTSNNGPGTLVGGFTYDDLSVTASAPAAGNITGGTTLTVDVTPTTTVGDTTATVGGLPATVTAVTPTTVDILTPAIPEGDASLKDIVITNSNGSGTLCEAFTYT